MDGEEFDLKRIGCVLRGLERVSTESPCSGEGKGYVTFVRRMSCSSKIRRLQHGSPRRPLRDDAEDVDRLRDSQREGRRRITPRCILPRVPFFSLSTTFSAYKGDRGISSRRRGTPDIRRWRMNISIMSSVTLSSESPN